jgi:hypothetical protein
LSTSRRAIFAARLGSVEEAGPHPNHASAAGVGSVLHDTDGARHVGHDGAPKVSVRGEVLRPDDTPIYGLYGVGNRVGYPSGACSWAGGATAGPMLGLRRPGR